MEKCGAVMLKSICRWCIDVEEVARYFFRLPLARICRAGFVSGYRGGLNHIDTTTRVTQNAASAAMLERASGWRIIANN